MRAPSPPVTQGDWEAMSYRMLRAARVLLASGDWEAAYYLSGYAVEFAFKCRIMDALALPVWPSRRARPDLHVHELSELAKLARVEARLMAEARAGTRLGLGWLVVRDWSASVRYDPRSFPQRVASDMVDAVDESGLQAWLIP